MPHRNSTTRKDQPDITLTFRRSPRLLTKNLSPAEYPKTPDPQSEKTQKRYQELKSGSKFCGKLETGSRRSATVTGNVCLRRSPRFSGNKSTTTDEKIGSGVVNRKGLLNVGEAEVGINQSKEILAKIEKRVSRHSSRGVDECVKKITEEELSVVESSKFSGKLETGSRRSATVNGNVCLRRSPRCSGNKSTTTDEKIGSGEVNRKGLLNVGEAEVGINQSKEILAKIEKRVSRHSSRGVGECVKKITEEPLSVVESSKVCGSPSKQFRDRSEKMTKRGSTAEKVNGNGFMRSTSTGILDKNEGFLDVERAKVGGNSCKKIQGKLEKKTIYDSGASVELRGGEGEKVRNLDRGIQEFGIKRKRNQDEEGLGFDKVWTKDQEMALQRAYFSAKPTPLFWKKVAKLVPGKSAKDCFNKLHSDHSTPPQPRTRMRSRKTNSPSSSLLTSSTFFKAEEPITKKLSRRRQSRHLAQKTVRKLLQKHYNVDQNYEADLFSVLESTMNPSTQALQKGSTHSTPERAQKDSKYLKKCCERSSSAHDKKHMSRLSGSYGATLASPPVLKPVKNKALHEKYIDQLHCREAKRRAAKVLHGKENRKKTCVDIQKPDAIKAAKDALVFDAKDVIHQFHHVKVSGTCNFSDFDDDFVESEDNEVEDEP